MTAAEADILKVDQFLRSVSIDPDKVKLASMIADENGKDGLKEKIQAKLTEDMKETYREIISAGGPPVEFAASTWQKLEESASALDRAVHFVQVPHSVPFTLKGLSLNDSCNPSGLFSSTALKAAFKDPP